MQTPIIEDDYDAIPEELKDRRQWLLWDASADTPRRPHWAGNFRISWNDPDDWHTFDEAVEYANKQDSWGIGYVFTDGGPYTFIDLDGCLTDTGGPKEWLPSTKPFNYDTYIERSASGDGLHVILDGFDIPGWWTDSHFSDDEHEGVEVYDQKFCAFTGSPIDVSAGHVGDVDAREWLIQAYKSINGTDPLRDSVDADSVSNGNTASRDEFLDEEDIRGALEHIDPDVAYPMWRDIGFALKDFFGDSATALRVFRDWSMSGTKWGSDAESQAERIIKDAQTGGGRTVGTIVHHARQNGWEMPTPTPQHATNGHKEAETDADADLYNTVQEQVVKPLYREEDAISNEEARQRLANILCVEYDFLRPREDTRGWRDTLYVYNEQDGIYEPHGEAFVEQEVERLMGQWASNQRAREIVGKLERRARVNSRKLETAPERLVVANGILDLTTGELDETTPDEYHQTMVDVEYHSDAECPEIDSFLHDVVDDTDVPTLYRLIAHSLYKEYTAEKAAMLLGDGRNGKSVFLSLVEEFLGGYNVSNKSLQELNEDEWAANNLVGKLANVHPDMSDQTVETMQMFKKLTGRDTVSANVKFEEPIRFENYATLIFACNRMPVLNDDTRGNWRRWLLIDFPNTFEPDAEDTEPKERLMRRMTTDEELQGLLAQCVEEITAWADGRPWFPKAPSWQDARRRIRRAAEPIYDFSQACLDDADEGCVETSKVRRAYRAYAKAEGLPTMSREVFGKKLLQQVDYTIEKKQKRINGSRSRVYEGIELTSRGQQLLSDDDPDDSQQSSMGGPQYRADQIVELVRAHADADGGVSHDMLVGLAIGEGMTPEQAEGAIAKARNQGSIAGTDEYFDT